MRHFLGEPDVASPLASIDAEWALLGTLLIEPTLADKLDGLVTADDFFEPVHGRIFRWALASLAEGGRGDALTLAPMAEVDKGLAALGGKRYLLELSVGACSIQGAVDYARHIAELAERRRLTSLAERLIRECKDTSTKAADLRDWLESELAAATSNSAVFTTYGEAVTEALTVSAAAAQRGDGRSPTASYFGIDALDEATDGIEPGELVICAGRTGMGKSAFGHEYARRVARQGRAVLYITLEMRPDRLANRGLGAAADVIHRQIRRGTMQDDEYERVRAAAAADRDIPLTYVNKRALTASGAIQLARRFARSSLCAKRGLGLVVLDHGGLLKLPGYRARHEESTGSVNELLDGVKDNDIPMLCLWQINREAEKQSDRRPAVWMLRDSGAVEQNADKIWLLYRESVYAKHEDDPSERMRLEFSRKLEVILGKNREGDGGRAVEILLDPSTNRFWAANDGRGE